MAKIVEAQLRLSAEDRLSAIVEKAMQRAERAAKVSRLSDIMQRQAQAADRAERAFSAANRAAASQAGYQKAETQLRATEKAAADVAKRLDAARKAAAAFGDQRLSKGSDLYKQRAEAKKTVTELGAAHRVAVNQIRRAEAAFVGEKDAIEKAEAAVKEFGIDLKDLTAHEIRLRQEIDRTSAALQKQIRVEQEADRVHGRGSSRRGSIAHARLNPVEPSAMSRAGAAGTAVIGRGAGAAVGAAGAAIGLTAIANRVGKAVTAYADLQTMAKDLQITAEQTEATVAKTIEEFRGQATAIGSTPEEMLGVTKALVSSGLEYDKAVAATIPTIKTAKGAFAEMLDVGKAGTAALSNLEIPVESLGRAYDIMAKAGKEGKVELRDMARLLPSAAAAGAAIGMKGLSGLTDITAALETIGEATGSPELAENRLTNLFGKITAGETAKGFKDVTNGVVDLQKELDKGAASGKSRLETFLDLLQSATKGDAFKMNEILGDVQAREGAQALLKRRDLFNARRTRIARDSAGMVDRDFAEASKRLAAEFERLGAAVDRLGGRMGEALSPPIAAATSALTNFLDRVENGDTMLQRLASRVGLDAKPEEQPDPNKPAGGGLEKAPQWLWQQLNGWIDGKLGKSGEDAKRLYRADRTQQILSRPAEIETRLVEKRAEVAKVRATKGLPGSSSKTIEQQAAVIDAEIADLAKKLAAAQFTAGAMQQRLRALETERGGTGSSLFNFGVEGPRIEKSDAGARPELREPKRVVDTPDLYGLDQQKLRPKPTPLIDGLPTEDATTPPSAPWADPQPRWIDVPERRPIEVPSREMPVRTGEKPLDHPTTKAIAPQPSRWIDPPQRETKPVERAWIDAPKQPEREVSSEAQPRESRPTAVRPDQPLPEPRRVDVDLSEVPTRKPPSRDGQDAGKSSLPAPAVLAPEPRPTEVPREALEAGSDAARPWVDLPERAGRTGKEAGQKLGQGVADGLKSRTSAATEEGRALLQKIQAAVNEGVHLPIYLKDDDAIVRPDHLFRRASYDPSRDPNPFRQTNIGAGLDAAGRRTDAFGRPLNAFGGVDALGEAGGGSVGATGSPSLRYQGAPERAQRSREQYGRPDVSRPDDRPTRPDAAVTRPDAGAPKGTGAGEPGAVRTGQMMAYAMDQLRREGAPEGKLREGAAHLVGQAQMESGLDPNKVHDGGTGYGIYGARDPKPGRGRRTDMLKWLEANGYARNSGEGQMRYMAKEAMSGTYPKTKRILMGGGSGDIEGDTNTITAEFENPAVVNRRSHAVQKALQVGPELPALVTKPDPLSGPAVGSQIGLGGRAAKTGLKGVDPRLTDVVSSAAGYLPEGYTAKIISAVREGDPRFHGQGKALDIEIADPKGNKLGNYQDASAFRAYEKFAQNARKLQMERYPDLEKSFRWGGYFGGPKGKYGALDTMHFDLGGERTGMGGGSWEKGLTPEQRAHFPGAFSQGMGDASTYKLPEKRDAGRRTVELPAFARDEGKSAPQVKIPDEPAGGTARFGLGGITAEQAQQLTQSLDRFSQTKHSFSGKVGIELSGAAAGQAKVRRLESEGGDLGISMPHASKTRIG